jgi:hypothetical protein
LYARRWSARGPDAAKAWEATPSFGKKASRVFAVGMVAPCAQAARLLKSDKVGAVVVKDS